MVPPPDNPNSNHLNLKIFDVSNARQPQLGRRWRGIWKHHKKNGHTWRTKHPNKIEWLSLPGGFGRHRSFQYNQWRLTKLEDSLATVVRQLNELIKIWQFKEQTTFKSASTYISDKNPTNSPPQNHPNQTTQKKKNFSRFNQSNQFINDPNFSEHLKSHSVPCTKSTFFQTLYKKKWAPLPAD